MREIDPANTILDGEGLVPVLDIFDWGGSPFVGFHIDGITIRNGQGDYFGGLGLETDAGVVRITNNIISNNSADNWTGGIYVYSYYSDVTLSGNTIQGNTAPWRAGLYAGSGSGNVTLLNNVIARNTATYSSGGLEASAEEGEVLLVNNTVTGNNVTEMDGEREAWP